jgi:hypothetical protein
MPRGARLTATVTTQPGVVPVRASAVVATTKALVGIEGGGGLEQRIGAWIVLSAGGIPQRQAAGGCDPCPRLQASNPRRLRRLVAARWMAASIDFYDRFAGS